MIAQSYEDILLGLALGLAKIFALKKCYYENLVAEPLIGSLLFRIYKSSLGVSRIDEATPRDDCPPWSIHKNLCQYFCPC